MHIQPYFPEPLAVKGNVADERYLVTLGFIRTTMAGHFLSVCCVALVAVFLEPPLGLVQALDVFLLCLVALTLVRRGTASGLLDNTLSLLLLAPTVISIGAIAGLFQDAGFPVWAMLVPYLAASAYGALCGKDFSFVGQFVLTTFATSLVLAGAAVLGAVSWGEAGFWGLLGMGFVGFYIYDLAALLSRRTLGEEPAAVADLYRDLLNFITYSVRVVLHWRRFRFI